MNALLGGFGGLLAGGLSASGCCLAAADQHMEWASAWRRQRVEVEVEQQLDMLCRAIQMRWPAGSITSESQQAVWT